MKKLLVALLILASSVGASAAISTPGNLVVGFRAFNNETLTELTNNVVIDLGSLSDINKDTRNTYDLSGVGSIMSTTYGANWWNRSDLYYGVFSYNWGFNDNGDIVQEFNTTRQDNIATFIPDGSDVFNSVRGQAESLTLNTPETASQVGLGNGSVSATTRGGSSFTSEYLVLDKSDPYSWTSLSTGKWGGIFGVTQDNLVTSFNSQTNALGIVSYAGTIDAPSQTVPAAVYISNGSLVVVPEPSTYMLLAVACSIIFFVIRRRKMA